MINIKKINLEIFPPNNNFQIIIISLHNDSILDLRTKIFLETNKHTELKLRDSQRILKDKIIGDVRLMILQ